MIKVLIVDDSNSVAMVLEQILNSDPKIHVEKIASSGEEAIKFLAQNKVDVITMDIVMPGMNGFETTKKIMETTPTPIVVISSTVNLDSSETSFKALKVGAVSILEKPTFAKDPNFDKQRIEIIETVKMMSEIKVIRRWSSKKRISPIVTPSTKTFTDYSNSVIAIGASTGGPPAIQEILLGLSGGKCPLIVIVQHICEKFVEGMAKWLESTTGFKVSIPKDAEKIKNGHIYLAPDDCHMGFYRKGIIKLSNEQYNSHHMPSVDYLFDSIAKVYRNESVGIILTGMGKDGASGITNMKNAGAETIAQDEKTSVVFSMNGEAIKKGGINHILPIDKIAKKIFNIVC